jgi:hypothetical protein
MADPEWKVSILAEYSGAVGNVCGRRLSSFYERERHVRRHPGRVMHTCSAMIVSGPNFSIARETFDANLRA